VSAVTAVVAEAGGNITDLSTRLSGELYVLLAEVDLPSVVDPEQLDRDLVTAGLELGVEVSLRALDPDVL
jgi:glycine cleavage system transcriptional repressor